MSEKQRNWAGNYTYTAARIHYPATVKHVQELITSHDKLKPLGTRHSFNDVADSPADLVSLEHLDGKIGGLPVDIVNADSKGNPGASSSRPRNRPRRPRSRAAW